MRLWQFFRWERAGSYRARRRVSGPGRRGSVSFAGRSAVFGAPGHGRTPRPGIEERLEVHAPPVPRLFPSTPYGTSVWSRFLFEHYACRRPPHRVAAWLGDQGLPVAPGTLADSAPRFVPLFEPLAEASRAHQNASALRHADETTWRVRALRAEGRSARAWLWTSVGNDAVYFHIDPSRGAEAAQTLFGELRSGTVLVCDHYSAYKKLARLLGGMVILQFCWRYVAARIMLRRAGIAALDLKILVLSAT